MTRTTWSGQPFDQAAFDAADAACKAADAALKANKTPETWKAWKDAGNARALLAAKPKTSGSASRAGKRQHAEMRARRAR